jgi:hypothetical protein
MLWVRWAFIALNVVYCASAAIYWSRYTKYNQLSRVASAAPYLWQLIGVSIVVYYGFSAWHLVWWFIIGYLLSMMFVRIMIRMGREMY